MELRVVKVGGSLFVRPCFLSELTNWLRCQAAWHSVLVVGGGVFADQVRQLDQRGGVSVPSAHGLAIRAMSLLAWTLSQMEPTWLYRDTWVGLRAALASQGTPRTIVFDPARCLRDDEPRWRGIALPVGWQVTSDSIAARVAEALGAQELVLLKSSLTTARDAQQASCLGYVDEFFPQSICGGQIVRCVDLPGRRQVIWQVGN